MYSWHSTEPERSTSSIDGRIIEVPTIRMLPLAYSVCGICTILVVMVAAALTSGIANLVPKTVVGGALPTLHTRCEGESPKEH